MVEGACKDIILSRPTLDCEQNPVTSSFDLHTWPVKLVIQDSAMARVNILSYIAPHFRFLTSKIGVKTPHGRGGVSSRYLHGPDLAWDGNCILKHPILVFVHAWHII